MPMNNDPVAPKEDDKKKRVAALLAALVILAALYPMAMFFVPRHIRQTYVLDIEPGMSMSKVAAMLYDESVIKHKAAFAVLSRITGVHKNLMVGRYKLGPVISEWGVFWALYKGRAEAWEITVPEGFTMADIRDRFAAEGLINSTEFDRLSRDKQFMAELGIEKSPSLEGYLFPDTYRVYKGIGERRLIDMMVGRLKALYTDDLKSRAAAMRMDMNKVLTMASIIEREAKAKNERQMISAVYHNRLRRGMRLQADPTAIYGVKPLNAGVLKKDLRNKTPYNTYIIKGLPPGPIASPGMESIKAALYPASEGYVYFVSNNNGTHTFSRTMGEHRRAVSAYHAMKAKERALLKKKQRDKGGAKK